MKRRDFIKSSAISIVASSSILTQCDKPIRKVKNNPIVLRKTLENIFILRDMLENDMNDVEDAIYNKLHSSKLHYTCYYDKFTLL